MADQSLWMQHQLSELPNIARNAHQEVHVWLDMACVHVHVTIHNIAQGRASLGYFSVLSQKGVRVPQSPLEGTWEPWGERQRTGRAPGIFFGPLLIWSPNPRFLHGPFPVGDMDLPLLSWGKGLAPFQLRIPSRRTRCFHAGHQRVVRGGLASKRCLCSRIS